MDALAEQGESRGYESSPYSGGRNVPNNRYLLALVLDDTIAMTSILQFFYLD